MGRHFSRDPPKTLTVGNISQGHFGVPPGRTTAVATGLLLHSGLSIRQPRASEAGSALLNLSHILWPECTTVIVPSYSWQNVSPLYTVPFKSQNEQAYTAHSAPHFKWALSSPPPHVYFSAWLVVRSESSVLYVYVFRPHWKLFLGLRLKASQLLLWVFFS